MEMFLSVRIPILRFFEWYYPDMGVSSLLGNVKGEVILFEPPTSEHISARTIFDPIISLAPASDCRTYAIG